MDGVRLRPVQAGDLPFLRRVYADSRATELLPLPWSDAQKAAFLDMQFDAQKAHYEAHYPDCSFSVIERDGTPIGRLYVDRGDDIRIIDIALLAHCQKQGLGTALLQSLIEEARTSARSVSIHVEHNNPARHLYDRLGFRHVDSNGIYHLMEWRPHAAVR